MSAENKRILILAKTYPHPSNKSVETVCCAGVTEDGEWIRIYPIPYRFLQGDKQFKICDWIEADVVKRPVEKDRRPESYSIEASSIHVVGHWDTEEDALKRYRQISDLTLSSFNELIQLHVNEGKSLGAIKPYRMQGLEFKKVSAEWTPKELAQLSQMSMFDMDSSRPMLKKVPYEIRCVFLDTSDEHKEHRILLTDWEFSWTFIKLIEKYNDEKAKEELNKLWLDKFAEEKESYLILGTVHKADRYPNPFIEIGYQSIRKEMLEKGEQLSLFDL